MKINKISIEDTIFWIVWSMIAIAVIIASTIRLKYGTDVTDGAYWIAEPYLMLKGAIPYATGWSQTPTTSVLIAPIVGFLSIFCKNNEGIVLIYRYVGLLLRVIISAEFAIIISHKIDKRIAALSAQMIFFTIGLNYYGLSLGLFLISEALLYCTINEEIKKVYKEHFVSGIIMAFSVLAHNGMVVVVLYNLILILLVQNKQNKKLSMIGYYVMGGSAVAIPVILWLEIWSGWKLFSGLVINITQNNYFKVPRISAFSNIKLLVTDLLSFIIPGMVVVLFCIFIALLVLRVFLKQKVQEAVFSAVIIGLQLGVIIVSAYYSIYNFDSLDGNATLLVVFTTMFVWYFFMCGERIKKNLVLQAFFSVPIGIFITALVLWSNCTIRERYSNIIVAVWLALLLSYENLETLRRVDLTVYDKKRINWPMIVITTVVLLFSMSKLRYSYSYIHRDSSIDALVYRVESGVFKGCYTTEDRGKRLENFEKLIRRVVDEDDDVLIADLMPLGYMMTDAHPCTPTTWDPCYYRYGFQDDNLYKAYYERVGKIPNKILFVWSEPDEILSIDDEENEFAKWVKDNYHLTGTYGEGLFQFRVFECNNKE